MTPKENDAFYISPEEAKKIMDDVKALIIDEMEAIDSYVKAIEEVSKYPQIPYLLSILKEILPDERRHLRQLEQFKREIEGTP